MEEDSNELDSSTKNDFMFINQVCIASTALNHERTDEIMYYL